jgi:hypothetical protein
VSGRRLHLPALDAAIAEMQWKAPAIIHRIRKDVARDILAGRECIDQTGRSLKIAQRLIRYAAHHYRKQRKV